MLAAIGALATAHDAYGVSVEVLAVAAVGSALVFQLMGSALWRMVWREAGSAAGLPALLVLFFQQVLGIGAAMLVLLMLALAGAFHVPGLAVASVCAVLAALLATRWRRPAEQEFDSPAAPPPGIAAWEWCVLLGAVLAMGMMAWRFPGHWDDTAFHLPLARTIVEHQGLVANEWLRYPYFPAYAQLLMAAGLLLDASLAQWLATWPVAVALLGLMGAARWLAGHAAWGVAAWLLYISMPFVDEILGYAYVDASLTLFCTAALLAVAVWAQRRSLPDSARWLALAGLCAGWACGIKLQGLVAGAAIGMGILCCSGSARAVVRNLWIYGLACVAVCAFWYLRSYWFTGDPVHPAGAKLFGYYLWTARDLADQASEQAVHGVPKHWANFWMGLGRVKATFLCAAMLVPLMGWGRRRPWPLLWLVVVLMVLFWFWVSQVDRYLMPVLPIGALMALMLLQPVVAWGLSRWKVPAVQALPMVVALVLMGHYVWVVAGALRQRPPVQAQRDAHEEIALLRQATALEPQYGRHVLNFGYENAFFYYQGQMVGDWFGPATYAASIECSDACRLRSSQEVEQSMRRFGVRMVLINSQRFRFDVQEFSARFLLVAQNGSAYLYALKDDAGHGVALVPPPAHSVAASLASSAPRSN